MIEQLSDKEAREILNDGRIGRLGCIADGYPYVVPVSYVVDDNCVYIHSLPGKKVFGLRSNPRACIQVDQIVDDCHWRSVIAFGNYEEITAPIEKQRILQKLFSRFPKLTPVESSIAADTQTASVIIISIRIDKMTAIGEGGVLNL